MYSRKRRGLLAAALTATTLFMTAMGAHVAQADSPQDSTTTRLDSFWASHGVDAATRTRLIDAFNRGITPDSLAGTKTPVLTDVPNGDDIDTIATFPDGSVSVTSIQQPSSAASSSKVRVNAIKGCSTGGTSGHITYSNCSISGDNGVIVLGFQASFTYVQGGYDLIENKGKNSYQSCAPGTCTDPKFSSWKQYETSSSRANLVYKTTYEDPTRLAISGNAFLTLYVGGNAATTKFTGP